MFWRDFFYFSKGERRGLIILLILIVAAGTLLFLNKQPKTPIQNVAPTKITETPKTEEKASKDSVIIEEKKEPTPARNTKESVTERVNRLTARPQPTTPRQSNYTRAEKFEEGTVVELNTADTTTLKKVPGIGSAFANRIVNYRKILGGFHSVTQLSEVYGIDEERYIALKPWFSVDPSHIRKIEINKIPQDSLQRHPYISYGQARVIIQQRRQKGKLTGWENLQLLNEFTELDKQKLQPYLSFE